MSILYALIAKEKTVVLAEYTEYVGNFVQITTWILKRTHESGKYSIKYDKYFFHYINEDKITYLCMTENFPDNLAFAFLSDLQHKLISEYEYDKLINMIMFELDKKYKTVIQDLMDYYNKCPTKNENGDVIQELIEAKNIAIENVEKILDRNEKITIMVTKAKNLNSHSKNINFITYGLQKKARKKKIKNMIMIGGGIVICILLFIFII